MPSSICSGATIRIYCREIACTCCLLHQDSILVPAEFERAYICSLSKRQGTNMATMVVASKRCWIGLNRAFALSQPWSKASYRSQLLLPELCIVTAANCNWVLVRMTVVQWFDCFDGTAARPVSIYGSHQYMSRSTVREKKTNAYSALYLSKAICQGRPSAMYLLLSQPDLADIIGERLHQWHNAEPRTQFTSSYPGLERTR